MKASFCCEEVKVLSLLLSIFSLYTKLVLNLFSPEKKNSGGLVKLDSSAAVGLCSMFNIQKPKIL